MQAHTKQGKIGHPLDQRGKVARFSCVRITENPAMTAHPAFRHGRRLNICSRSAIGSIPTAKEKRVWVVRIFVKKTQKTPRKEIKLALKRAEEIT